MKRSNEESLEVQFHKRSKIISTNFKSIVNNPGFQNITEKIFLNLNFEDLMACQLINKSCKEILDYPMFWLKIWRLRQGLSPKNHSDWAKAIQMTQNTTLKGNVCSYIKKIVQIGHLFVDVPCFIDYETIKSTMETIRNKFSPKWSIEDAIFQEKFGILQIMAAKEKNLNVIDEVGRSLIYNLARKNFNYEIFEVESNIKTRLRKRQENDKYLEDASNVIKVLAPLIKEPNAPYSKGIGATPIVTAALLGHLDIVQALIPYVNNANESGILKRSAICAAIRGGHEKIVKILSPLCNNYLAVCHNEYGSRISGNLIHFAIACNMPESIKYLAPFMDNPNAPDSTGLTPLEMARNRGLDDVVKFLNKTSEIKKPGRRTTILHSAKAARLQQGQAGWAELELWAELF